jgi:predicted ester cyclase
MNIKKHFAFFLTSLSLLFSLLGNIPLQAIEQELSNDCFQIQEQNISLIRNLFAGTLNSENISNYGNIFTDDCIIHAFDNRYDLDFGKEFDAKLAKSFDLISAEIHHIFALENRVYVNWTFSFRHVGEYEGITPTNKDAHISGFSIYRFKDNKICEVWQFWDRLSILEQINSNINK